MSVRRLLVLVAWVGASIWFAAPAGAASGGTKLWPAFYDGGVFRFPRDGDDTPHATVSSPDGTKVFVTGSSDGPTGQGKNYTTIAYNPSTGAQLWLSTYTSTVSGAPVQYDDVAYAIAVSPDSSKVYVTGKSRGAFATIAYNASTGAVVWQRLYSANGAATAITVSPDGATVYVTGDGTNQVPGATYDYATVAYNAITGAQLWFSTFNGTSNKNDWARAITVTPDGSRVIITGYSYREQAGPVVEWMTIAYAALTGTRLWAENFNPVLPPDPRGQPQSGLSEAYSMAMSPDGSFVAVTGETTAVVNFETTYQISTIAYDPVTGAQRWIANQPGQTPAPCINVWGSIGCDNPPIRVAVSPDAAKVYVTGGPTYAYAADTGTTLWSATYPGNTAGVAVSGDGTKVVVTGTNFGDVNNDDYVTIAYDSTTGAQLWLTRHNFRQLGSRDDAQAITIVPGDHIVIVTGGTETPPYPNNGPTYDFATAAIAL